jgi:hypothetical protein
MQLPKSIRRITIVDDSGGGTVYERERKSKRRTRWLRPGEGALKRVAQALEQGSASYLRGHRKSNSKRKDGWLRDNPRNVIKAQRKALKKLIRF